MVTPMPLLWKPYTSDVTQLIAQLKSQRPTLEAEQQKGRALLWDKSIDLETQQQFKAARVAQQPYVYQTKS
jgi:hypothetical protein